MRRTRLRMTLDRARREGHYAVSRLRIVAQRLVGNVPDPNVSDDVLADRIRSYIGPVEKHLDVPHVHVMVADHVATLHGDVTDATAAAAIEHAVRHVSGVAHVESHLHRGLIPGDVRPSEGGTSRDATAHR